MDRTSAFDHRDDEADGTGPQMSAADVRLATQLGTELGLKMVLALAEAEATTAKALLASHRRHCICHAGTLVAEEIEAERTARGPGGFFAAYAGG